MIYLSGSIGHVCGEPKLVPGGIGPETRQALAYLKENLERAGSSLDRVVKCTVFLSDIGDFGGMNEEYQKFFPVDPPAGRRWPWRPWRSARAPRSSASPWPETDSPLGRLMP